MSKSQLINNLFNNERQNQIENISNPLLINTNKPKKTYHYENSYTENIDFIELDRVQVANEIKNILNSFESNCRCINFKKGIYIYGSPGCGKTRFVMDILKSLNYDVIKYDAGDVRNKSLIETITSNNISNRNVLHLMSGQIKKIAIVMDEIDGMNNGDKGGITSLIKLIRQKKTKKQKTENITLNPIICIGNYYIDKKIKELMKVCNVFELKTPTNQQIEKILHRLVPIKLSPSLKSNILNYIQGDLVKLEFVVNLYKKKPELLSEEIISAIFVLKSYNYDAKKITHTLINNHIPIEEHATFMNETDRTIVSLLYHENIIDTFTETTKVKTLQSKTLSKNNIDKPFPKEKKNASKKKREIKTKNDISPIIETSQLLETVQPLETTQTLETIRPSELNTNMGYINFYIRALDNICYADYIDRITFQNQIWVFNEMSSLIKTFYNNYIYHQIFPNNSGKFQPEEVRFTKVLTKYSTEYNNQLFIYNFCQELNMDKRDMKAFFKELRLLYGKSFYNQNDKLNQVMELFQTLNICKLDVKRIYRYLDKNVKVDDLVSNELDEDELEYDEI